MATMLNVGKRQKIVTLGRQLLRRPSCRDVLLTSTTYSRVWAILLMLMQGAIVGTTAPNVLCVASKVTSSGTAPKAGTVRWEKASMARATARPAIKQQQSTRGSVQHTGSKTTAMSPASAIPRFVGLNRGVYRDEPATPVASTQKDDDFVYICVPRGE